MAEEAAKVGQAKPRLNTTTSLGNWGQGEGEHCGPDDSGRVAGEEENWARRGCREMEERKLFK